MQSKFHCITVGSGSSAKPTSPHTIEIESVRWGFRKIPPAHGLYLTGKFPMGKGRGSVAFNSGLERDALEEWRPLPGLKRVLSQPVTVFAKVNGVRCVYTPDFDLQFDSLPENLRRQGYSKRTIVEVKPYNFNDMDHLMIKLYLIWLATGVDTVLLWEREDRFPNLQGEFIYES